MGIEPGLIQLRCLRWKVTSSVNVREKEARFDLTAMPQMKGYFFCERERKRGHVCFNCYPSDERLLLLWTWEKKRLGLCGKRHFWLVQTSLPQLKTWLCLRRMSARIIWNIYFVFHCSRWFKQACLSLKLAHLSKMTARIIWKQIFLLKWSRWVQASFLQLNAFLFYALLFK